MNAFDEAAPLSLWDRLPLDVVSLILQHRAAMVIQQRWWRLVHYGHARQAIWYQVRCHLAAIDAYPRLLTYPIIRREWRREAVSWLATDAILVRDIRCEARLGLWGQPSPRLM